MILVILNGFLFLAEKKEIIQHMASGNDMNVRLNLRHPDEDSYNAKETRIAVSLTTIPSRIQHIEPTLTSLLTHQSMALDKLYLVLPKTKWILTKTANVSKSLHYEIPEFLTNFTKHDDRVEILRPEYDYGPVDKIIYALKEEDQRAKLLTNDMDDAASTQINTKVIYLDDDVIYHNDLVKTLVTKSFEYPDSVIALSGAKLKSHFRQIAHRFPRKRYDKHPNLYFVLSGSESLLKDEIVDVVQGFAGVLVVPSFFDIPTFFELVQTVTRKADIWKADDFIISGYLEYAQISKRVVASQTLSTFHKPAAKTDNLGNGMHRQTMMAAHDLQSRLKIWQEHTFVNYLSLEAYWRDLMDCEAGHPSSCKRAENILKYNATISTTIIDGNHTKPQKITRQSSTKILDDYFLPQM